MTSTTARLCALAVVFCGLAPAISAAQTPPPAVSLVNQVRGIASIVAIPPATPGLVEKKIRDFAEDPWNKPAPTAAEIQQTLSSLKVTVGAAQGAAEGLVLPQAAFITGLTDFIINRAKDEITISFLLDLRERIDNDDLLRRLFPRTLVVSTNLEAQSAKQLLGPLKAALTADVRNIPKTILEDQHAIDDLRELLAQHLTPDNLTKLNNAVAEFKKHQAALAVAARALRDLLNGVAPLATIAQFADLTPATFPDPRGVRYGLITVGTLAREYRWAPNNTREVLSDPVALPQFLALLKRDLLLSQTNESTDVETWAGHAQLVQTKLNDVLASLEAAGQVVTTLRSSLAAATPDVGQTSADLANAVLQIVASAAPFASDDNAWRDLSTRIEHINKLQVSLFARDYMTAVTEIEMLVLDATEFTLPNGVVKTLTFAGTLASARTSAEVTSAIQAAALPVTSFRAKRTRSEGETHSWVGLNAYVGGGVGREHTSESGVSGDTVGFGGLTVPVGIEWGTSLSSNHVKSIAAFFPILDVGTVASFRFNGQDTEHNPSLTFAQVLAPGAFVTLGITQKIPVTVAFGAQFVPQLRRATGGGQLFDVVRYGTFVAIDVPIFRLH